MIYIFQKKLSTNRKKLPTRKSAVQKQIKASQSSKNFTNTVEYLGNFYQESLQITVIHQYKATNSGINNINSAMVQTLQIAQSIITAIKSIVNSNDEKGDLADAAILKLESDLSYTKANDNYMEILSVLKKLTSRNQNNDLKFNPNANPFVNMSH